MQFLTFDAPIATAVAALVAALASIVSLFFTIRAARFSEMRIAHRKAIEPYLVSLSTDIHEVIAGIVVARKRIEAGQEDAAKWIRKSQDAGDRLKITRKKTLYFLPKLQDSLRELSLAGDHIATYKNLSNTNVDQVVSAYRTLSDRTNKAVELSYRRGKGIGLFRTIKLNRASSQVRHLWNQRPTKTSA